MWRAEFPEDKYMFGVKTVTFDMQVWPSSPFDCWYKAWKNKIDDVTEDDRA